MLWYSQERYLVREWVAPNHQARSRIEKSISTVDAKHSNKHVALPGLMVQVLACNEKCKRRVCMGLRGQITSIMMESC